MSFVVRDAVSADIPAITEIYADAVANGTASYELVSPGEDEMLRRYLAVITNGYPYVAVDGAGGRLLGYAYASAFRTRPAYRWMVEDSIYLAPSARGMGLGKMLLQDLLLRCTALGFRQMVAVIGGASPASVALHTACGFAMTGTLKGSGFKHGVWLDTALMQRALGEGTDSDPDEAGYPGTLFSG